MPEQPDIDALLEEALELKWFLPVLVDAQAAPLVWADPAQRQGLLALQERALAIGAHLTTLASQEVLAIYGSTVTRWIYHVGRDPIAFFLSVQVDAPVFSRSPLDLPAHQASFVLGFNVLQQATVVLLRAIITSRSLLLHFSAVPDWVPQLPPLSSGRSRHGGHEEDMLELVRTSIPIGFTADALTRMQSVLDRLPRTRL